MCKRIIRNKEEVDGKKIHLNISQAKLSQIFSASAQPPTASKSPTLLFFTQNRWDQDSKIISPCVRHINSNPESL